MPDFPCVFTTVVTFPLSVLPPTAFQIVSHFRRSSVQNSGYHPGVRRDRAGRHDGPGGSHGDLHVPVFTRGCIDATLSGVPVRIPSTVLREDWRRELYRAAFFRLSL